MQRCMGCMREFGAEYDVCPSCGYIVGTKAASKNHLMPGTVLLHRYTLGRVLGQGGFGITYIAWDNKLGRRVAVKEYMPNIFASRMTGEKNVLCYNDESTLQFNRGKEKIARECITIASLHEVDGVVRVYDYAEENNTSYIIMEFLSGRTVKEILQERGRFSFAETMRIMTPVLQTLDAMHKSGMIHRDVAPDNIFVCNDGKVKLLDFGAARLTHTEMDEKSVSVILKHGYAPREQYTTRSEQGPYTDVYSAGATIYKMLTGETPPESIERTGNDREDFAALLALDLPRRVKTAVTKGMCLDKNKRTASAQQLLEELAPFFPQEAETSKKRSAGPAHLNRQPRSKDEQKKETLDPAKRFRVIKMVAAVLIVVITTAIGVIVAHHFMGNDDRNDDSFVEKSVSETAPLGSFADFSTAPPSSTGAQADVTTTAAATTTTTAASTTKTQPATSRKSETTAKSGNSIRQIKTPNVTYSGDPISTDSAGVIVYCPPGFSKVRGDGVITLRSQDKQEQLWSGSAEGTGYYSDEDIRKIESEYKNGPSDLALETIKAFRSKDGVNKPSDVWLIKIGKNKWYIIDYEDDDGYYCSTAISMFGHYMNQLISKTNVTYFRAHELMYQYVDTEGK